MTRFQNPGEGRESPAVLSGSSGEPPEKTAWHILIRSSLGGAIWGILLGVFMGTACGIACGVFCDDPSLGLDGALIGGLAAVLPGAIYGGVLGVRGTAVPRAGAEGPAVSGGCRAAHE
jgi:hypothetical protein